MDRIIETLLLYKKKKKKVTNTKNKFTAAVIM